VVLIKILHENHLEKKYFHFVVPPCIEAAFCLYKITEIMLAKNVNTLQISE
jgi:hypothetical protein